MNHRQAILKMPDRLKHSNIVHVHGVGLQGTLLESQAFQITELDHS